jgi:maltose O-acetyltransferase
MISSIRPAFSIPSEVKDRPHPRKPDSLVRRIIAVQFSGLVHSNLRFHLLKLAGIKLGRGARVLSGVFFSSANCEIGEDSFINQGCHIDATKAWVRIGKNVQIGPSVNLITSCHHIAGPHRRAGELIGKDVTLEDGCWLATASTILPGVTVARGCVIAAGAVVTKDTEPNGLYAGVPAIRMRDLPD